MLSDMRQHCLSGADRLVVGAAKIRPLPPKPHAHSLRSCSASQQQSRGRRHAAVSSSEAAATSSGDETLLEGSIDEENLRAAFKEADRDGNGVIDREEMRRLLAEGSSKLDPVTLDWLASAGVSEIFDSFEPLDSADEGFGLTFQDFKSLVRAGTLLDGKFSEYREAFNRVDTTGNGRLNAIEIRRLFEELGQPLSETRLSKLFDEFDVDRNGAVDFGEFLSFFRDDLLDLKDILQYVDMRPRKADLGTVSLIFSEAELDSLLQQHSGRLVVLEASMTWCRPCKGFERSYQRFAEAFNQTLFLKVFGNANEDTKCLVEERLSVPSTPTFTFFRKGVALSSVTGTSRQRLYDALLARLEPEENPVEKLTVFQQQVWRSKLGLA